MLLRILDRLEEIIISALIAAATVIIFVAVVQRYGMSNAGALIGWANSNGMPWLSDAARAVFKFLNSFNLTWAQEVCIYLFVWMAKFGAAYGVRTGIHVGVDILLNALCRLLDPLLLERTAKQWQAIAAYRTLGHQRDVARLLGVTRQSVGDRLAADLRAEVEQADAAIAAYLTFLREP